MGIVLALEEVTDIERDAAIQRFAYTFEAVWKAARHVLLRLEGLDAASPKAVVRACRTAGILDDKQATQALVMADDRNLTSHTYNRDLAAAIYQRLPSHAALMSPWVEEMDRRLQDRPR